MSLNHHRIAAAVYTANRAHYEVDGETQDCFACHGTGYNETLTRKCGVCNGSGVVHRPLSQKPARQTMATPDFLDICPFCGDAVPNSQLHAFRGGEACRECREHYR